MVFRFTCIVSNTIDQEQRNSKNTVRRCIITIGAKAFAINYQLNHTLQQLDVTINY